MIEWRELDRSDIPEMAVIQRALTKKKLPRTWTRMVEQYLEDRHGVGFVAVSEGRVVGFVIGEVKGEGFGLRESGWIEVVGVAPQAMGEGIGKGLVDKLLEYFRRKKIRNVYTSVRWDVVDMVSFFKSLGFGLSDFVNLTRKL